MIIHDYVFGYIQREKLGTLGESTPDIYQHIPPRHVLDNGCIGQYGAILGEQLLGYPPKGTQTFPLIHMIASILRRVLVESEGMVYWAPLIIHSARLGRSRYI